MNTTPLILLIDNYDSFTYNLYQLLAQLGAEVLVARNDEIDLRGVTEISPRGIVISPGPGTPETAGISLGVIRRFAGSVPILGVCLGHQCVAQAYGARVVRAPELMHGKSSAVFHDGHGIFTDVPDPIDAIRYHSLAVDPATVPDCLELSAQTPTGTIMGLRHRRLDVEGVQFHPESIMTPHGPRMVGNWLRRLSAL